eukprot:5991478-Lingulodinium_polyedra.AAC.1
MGDHGAVEWAQEGHGEGGLRPWGLLREAGFLHGHEALPDAPFLEGFCIDDYFVLERVPLARP